MESMKDRPRRSSTRRAASPCRPARCAGSAAMAASSALRSVSTVARSSSPRGCTIVTWLAPLDLDGERARDRLTSASLDDVGSRPGPKRRAPVGQDCQSARPYHVLTRYVKRFHSSDTTHRAFDDRLASPPCLMNLAGAAASTASVRWLECWGFLSRRSATGRSATGRSSRSGARGATASTRATRWSSCASSRRRCRAACRRPTLTGCWPNRAKVASPRRTTVGRRCTRLLVLLAERDPVAADLAQFFLRTEGYDVHLALAVGDAEEQWLESRPQLAIVELMISGGRGRGAVPAAEAARCGRRARHLRPAGSRRGAGRGRRRLSAEAARSARIRLHRQGPARGERAGRSPRSRRVPDGGARHERRRRARPDPRRRSAAERHQPDHGAAGLGKDVALPAVHVRARDRGAPGDLPVDGLRAVREDPPLRPDAQLLRSRCDRPVGLLRGSRPGSGRRGRARRGHRADRGADQGAPAGDHRDRQLQGAGRVRRRRAGVPALPARARRTAHGLPRHQLLDRGIQRGRDAHRRRSSPSPTGSSRSRQSARASARCA